MIDFIIACGFVSIIFMPVVLLSAFFECTKIGRHIWDDILVPILIKWDILPDDYWDR